MWIALQLFGLQWCLAAVALGWTQPRSPRGPGREWIALGLAGRTAALLALLGARARLDPASLAGLAGGGALVGCLWLGAGLRSRVEPSWGWAFHKWLLSAGELALLGLASRAIAAYCTGGGGIPAVPPWCSAMSIAMGTLAGAMLYLIVVFWLRALRDLPPDSRLRPAGLSPIVIGLTIVAILIYRGEAIGMSLSAGWIFNPIAGHYFVQSLYRGAANLIFLRWMLGLVLPLGIALTLWIDPEGARVRTVRFQLIPILLLTILAEWLAGALVAGTGGLAI